MLISTSFVSQVSSLMVSLSLHTSFDVPLAHPSVWGLLVVCVFSTVSFYYVEENYASEPVVPMRLLRMKTPALINVAMGFYTSTLFARSVPTSNFPQANSTLIASFSLSRTTQDVHSPHLPSRRSRSLESADGLRHAAFWDLRVDLLPLRRMVHAEIRFVGTCRLSKIELD